ncbi:MAG: endonuclease/exonuclease/phosphatase family protein [Lentisphaeria bacterium]|nr:endonuclease/exonuclease/phosphatase family protein [Lentisphaeria bacterium]
MIVLSCNVRASTMANDKGPASWKVRRKLCMNVIAGKSPDIFCLQECSAEQFEDFCNFFNKDFDVFWINPYPDFDAPENAIFYRKGIFKVITYGGYHLNRTPHIANASCFGDGCNRVVNYIVFENTEKKRFRLVNTHLSVAPSSALPQAKMLLEDANTWNKDLVQILTGDMNNDVKTRVMQLILSEFRDSHAEATGIVEERFTCHDFLGENYKGNPAYPFDGKIDWILLKGNILCSKSEMIMTHEGDIYPSDHYFIAAELDL